MYVYLPVQRIKRQSHGVLCVFKCKGEPLKVGRRAGSVVLDPKLRGFDVVENGNDPFVGLHEKSELVEAEIGVTVARREDSNTNLAIQNASINVLEKPVPRFHVHAVQECPHSDIPGKIIVQQAGNVLLGVDPTVVDEDVAYRSTDFSHHLG